MTEADSIQKIAELFAAGDVVALDALGSALFQAGLFDSAAEAAFRLMEISPDPDKAEMNAGLALKEAGRIPEARKTFEHLVARNPDFIDGWIEYGSASCLMGRFDEALEKLLRVRDRLPVHDHHRDMIDQIVSVIWIRKGDFKKGMRELQKGRRLRSWGSYSVDWGKPQLSASSDIAGKTILLCGEGGAGDQIVDARFGQVIQSLGGRTVLAAAPELVSLFSLTPGISRVVEEKNILSEHIPFDYWLAASDSVIFFGLEPSGIPNTPYIFPKREYIEKWRGIIRSPAKLKIGIKWKGDASHEKTHFRAIPFSFFESLSAIPGVELYSLQKGSGEEELQAGSPVINLSPMLETWDDTAAAIYHLDLVISSCSGVPHLSAAIGKKTWIIVPLNSFHVWALPGDTTPWYPSVRLFRQQTFGSWQEPMAAIEAALRAYAKTL